MPSEKRKAGLALRANRGKRVRIGSSSIIGENDGASVISASGRPRRSTVGDPSYDQTRRHSRTTIKQEPKSKKVLPASQSTKRGPGRPKKSTTPTTTATLGVSKTTAVKRPVGRPPKTATHVELPVRKRGRTKKKISRMPPGIPAAKITPVKKTPDRGREQDLAEDSTGAVVQDAEWENSEPEEPAMMEDQRQFWLMKAEPDSRVQNGVDVGFSIDALKSKTEPEGWDGVRNPVARNNMRAMREGDLAFFYHSNCAIPGIAGIMQIVQEHSIDETAFDPKHPYYDPKSTDRSKPRWELVHVKFSHKFDNLITLKELKAHMGPGEPLENLQTLKQSRLSVSSVSPKEWNFIIDLSGEEFEDDQQSRRVDNEMSVDNEADETFTANADADVEFNVEDGTGALDLATKV